MRGSRGGGLFRRLCFIRHPGAYWLSYTQPTGGTTLMARPVPNQLTLEKHYIATDGRERPFGSGTVSHADEAWNEAALAILADHLRGDFPRA